MNKMPSPRLFPEKCEQLADRINEVFQAGLTLSKEVVHYIDSTFLNPSAKELEAILTKKNTCDIDALVELIFFPDEKIQAVLENLLEANHYNRTDEKIMLNCLLAKQIQTKIIFPDNRGEVAVCPSHPELSRFISRLNISKKLDKRVLGAINSNIFKEEEAILTRVKLRNARVEYTEDKILFLCAFFENVISKTDVFFKDLDYILGFLSESSVATEIFKSLMQNKKSHVKNLQTAKKFEGLLKKNNIETLMLQRTGMPYISVDEEKEKIEIIDRISLLVFGEI